MTGEQVLRSVRAVGLDAFDTALAQGKGAILVTAHFGNWERFAHYLTLRNYKLSVVARDANEERTTELINSARKRQGVEVFSRGNAAREMLRRLAKNEIVGIIPDQNSWELYVPFFGRPAGTVAGPAVISLRSGAPIVVAFCAEEESGDYSLTARLLPIPELSGDRAEDAKRIMAAINGAIEEAIRERPEQWLWMHDRWKAARQQGML